MFKDFFLFFSTSIRFLLLTSILAIVFCSCEKQKAPIVDPNELPLANFYFDTPKYKVIDGQTYAFITANNGSQYSNLWKWERPGSYEIFSGATVFETKSDSAITTAYLAIDQTQYFSITLTAYNLIKTDTSNILLKSIPITRDISIKKP